MPTELSVMHGAPYCFTGESEHAEFGLSDRAALALRRAADARSVTVAEIGRRIMEAVAADGLIEAVLDDGQEGAP